MIDNCPHTQTKYSNECFNIIENARHPKKQKTTQYTLLLYGTFVLAIKVKRFTRSDKAKYRTLKILLDSGTSTTILSVSLIPKARRNNYTTTNWYTQGGAFKTQAKETLSFQLPELYHTKTITYDMHVDDTNNSHRYDMIMVR